MPLRQKGALAFNGIQCKPMCSACFSNDSLGRRKLRPKCARIQFRECVAGFDLIADADVDCFDATAAWEAELTGTLGPRKT